jgi:YVTN family beta-propeller protein
MRATGPSGVRLRRFALALSVGFLLLLPGMGLLPLSPPTHPSTPVRVRDAAEPSSPRPASSFVGTIERSLVLYNQTDFAGNQSALWTQHDQYVAYDSENGTGWASGQSFVGLSTVDVFNTTNDLGIRMMAAGGGAEVAYDNRTNTMWVTGGVTSDNVTVYNASSYSVVRVVGTGHSPAALAYDWETRSMYIVDFGNDNITIVNDTTYEVNASSPNVGAYANDIAFDPGSGNLFVSNGFGQTVTSFYQSGSAAPTSISIPGAGELGTIADDPQNGMVYVSGVTIGVGIVNASTNRSAGTITLPNSAGSEWDGLAVDPAHHRLYVSQSNPGLAGNLASYQPAPTGNTSTSAANTSLGFDSIPYALAYDSRDAAVLVVDTNSYGIEGSNVTTISTSTGAQVASTGVERQPQGAVYDPVTHAIYVYDGGTGRLYKIDDATDQVAASAFVGYTPPNWDGYAGQVAYDPVNASIFVDWFDPNVGSFGVAEFSDATLTFLRNFTTGFNFPTGMAYDSADHKLFVANQNGANVTVLSTVSWQLSTAGTGSYPVGVAYAPNVDGIYVTNQGGNNVTVLNGATQATSANVNVGELPFGDVYDPTNGSVYVASVDTDTVTQIDTATNATVGYRIPLGGTLHGPAWLAYDPANTTVIATVPGDTSNLAGNAGISLLNVSNDSYYGQIVFGDQDYGLAYDTGTQSAFVVATYPGVVYEVGIGRTSSAPPPLSVSLTAAPASIPLGSTSDLETGVTGGTGPYSYAYSTLPAGCTTANLSTLPCHPAETGTFTVGVNVTDSLGDLGAAVAQLTVTPVAHALDVTLRAEPSTVAFDAATTLNTTVTGGTGYGTYTYAYSSLPLGCTSANRSNLACSPVQSGTFSIGVNVSDPAGDHGSALATVTVGPAGQAVIVKLTATPSEVTVGTPLVLHAQVDWAPVGVLTFLFTQLPPGCSSADVANLTCTPSSSGIFTPSVEVHDSGGNYANASTTVTVTAAPSSATTTSGLPSWTWEVLGAVIVAVLLLILFALARRRKKEPPSQFTAGPPHSPEPPSLP